MINNNTIKKLIYSAVAASIPMVGQAQPTALEEIVVTATKREQTIQDVPFSINAQTQEDIERSGATNIEEISRNIAGLSIQNLGPGQSQVAIRGVSAGQIVRDQPGVKEQVGIYVDESVISLSLFTPDLDFYDLNRVETLRGPQGTLFGSGSIGGTIRYITNQPDPEDNYGGLELNLNTLTDGEEGGHIKAFYNTPFGDGNAFRATVYHTEYGGFIDSVGPAGGDDVNSGSRTGGRFAVTFNPIDAWTITPRLIIQDIDTDGNNRSEVFNFIAAGSGIDIGEREQFLLFREGFEDETLIFDVTSTFSLGSVDITSITSFTDREIVVSRDASALTHSVSESFGLDEAVIALPSNLIDATDLTQITQETRVSSTTDGPIHWVAGFFYSDTERDYSQRLPTPGFDAFFDVSDFAAGLDDGNGLTSADVANGFPLDSPFNSDLPFDLEQFSIFGEVSFELNDRVELTFGGRYYDFEEGRDISQGGIFSDGFSGFEETESDGFTPRVLFSYDATDNLTFNGQVSQGFRLGGVNDPLNTGLCSGSDIATFGGFQDFGDEDLINYELGAKGSFGIFSFNYAAYYADISDLQVTLDAGTCSSRISFNVPDAHATGVEFELDVQPSDNLDISLALSVLEAEFDSTVVDDAGAIIGGIEDGNRLPSVPEFSGAVAFNYSMPANLLGGSGEWVFSSSLQHVGDRITQPSDQVAGAGIFVPSSVGIDFGLIDEATLVDVDLELPSYQLVNSSVGYHTEDWNLTFYINNLFDEDALLSFDRERGGAARAAFRTNQPRTFGLTFRTDF